MGIFKKLTTTMAIFLITSFMFLFSGAGVSLADGYARHFKPDHVKQNYNHAYHKNTARHQGRKITQRTVTTTRIYAPRHLKQRRADARCITNGSRHHLGSYRPLANNSFKRHQKLRHSNFRHQHSAQRHVRHNLGLFAALPGIIVNIPL